MDIFESLENLNVSEECFNDIVGLVEEYLNEEGFLSKVADKVTNAVTKSNNPIVSTLRKTPLVKNTIGKRAVANSRANYDAQRANYDKQFNNVQDLKGKSIFKATSHADPQKSVDAYHDAEASTRQARKNYHDTIDAYGIKPKNNAEHVQYQQTHDQYGRRKV